MQSDSLVAAVDLGSNSYRLEIARYYHGQLHRTEYLKETVRQGNGLDEQRNLTEEAMHRGWSCLARFGERLAGFPKSQVRAVATQTLREARNRDAFLGTANKILGFPIDVISGREEARLIYQGVAHLLPDSNERRLVIDIGGRSTEIILGQGLAAQELESYRVGSVAWSMRYFPDGQLNTSAFARAEIAAKAILDEAISKYPRAAWDTAYGASGTIGAVADILQASGQSPHQVSREGLEWLRRSLQKAQHVDRLKIEGLKDERRAVIGGGISVLCALMDLLSIDTLYAAEGALRHGVLHELIERDEGVSDIRSQTVSRLQRTFGSDLAQAERVSRVARFLLKQMGPVQPELEIERLERKLEWAASLHEIGGAISHSDSHKHGAYILDNSDAAGFALGELHRLSLLVLGHRGKLRKLEVDFSDELFVQQLLCLRLAVILCHARRDPDYEVVRLQIPRKTPKLIELSVPRAWSEAYPQSFYLLGEEVLAWQKTGWTLALKLDL